MPPKPRRKPHIKRATHTINISPAETHTFTIRSRRKPRKARLAYVKAFNELVKSGAVEVLEIEKDGITFKANRTITADEHEVLRTVSRLREEPLTRADKKRMGKFGIIDRKTDRYAKQMRAHCKKGQFEWIYSSLEKCILQGEDPHAAITLTEMVLQQAMPDMHSIVEAYNTPKKLERNWRLQLRYFERLMKDKGITEMVLEEENSTRDKSKTVVRLTPDGIIKETKAKIYSTGHLPTFEVKLHNGRISYRIGDLTSDNAHLN